MTFVHFRGATAYEMQIGRLWARFVYPTYWLYSANRAAFRKEHPTHPLAGRAWLYSTPVQIGWER